MSITVDLEENQRINVTTQIIETVPPAHVEFAAEGVITMTKDVLGAFAGSSLKPAALEVAVDSSRTVTIDLSNEASLRLDAVDVGVETPDTDDLPGMDSRGSATDASSDASPTRPGAIAFAVEGVITDVPAETLESLVDGALELAAITFAVDTPIRSDGGSGADVVFELTLLGYGIAIYRDGTIDIGTSDGATGIGLA